MLTAAMPAAAGAATFVAGANQAMGNGDGWRNVLGSGDLNALPLGMMFLVGVAGGLAGICSILHSTKARGTGRPEFVLIPAALTLAGGALGYLAARAAT